MRLMIDGKRHEQFSAGRVNTDFSDGLAVYYDASGDFAMIADVVPTD